ncbi:MAG: desulfoferrodoxin family protein [Lentihominibacter sp.]|nr:desulfoferrodoxin family protein [Lentihominibacter sp.]
MKFFRCDHCGNFVGVINDAGVPMMCCGQKMTEVVAGTTDAAVEKHVPVVTVDGNIVKTVVGSVEHPMIEEHYIEWIALETEKGAQRKTLKAGDAPAAEFALTADDKVVAAYAYCNLHGLWKSE